MRGTIAEATTSVRISSIWVFFAAVIAESFAFPSFSPPRIKHRGSIFNLHLHKTLSDIDRIFCLSDLHTDHVANLEWVQDRIDSCLNKRDLLIVAGDISHNHDVLVETLTLLRKRCQVFFIFGNHEAWLTREERDHEKNSFDKIGEINRICEELDVHTGMLYIEGKLPVWIVPIQSWYDGSLTFDQDLCHDFNKWPWVDFQRCNWTPDFPPAPRDHPHSKIPSGLVEHLHERNKPLLEHLSSHRKHADSVMTVSHFLPNSRTLPDWRDINDDEFDVSNWLDHGAAGVSAKFAKVAGSKLIDEQIRSVVDELGPSARLLHIFGHSHRPKDFEWDNIRYIHNPLGKPRERALYMIDPDVNAQHIWSLESGEVRGDTIIRYWEQYGGGKGALFQRLEEVRQGRYKRH